MKVLRHIRAIILLPLMATLVIPAVLLYLTGQVNIGWSLVPPLYIVPLAVGSLLVCIGLVLLIQTIRLFVTQGEGTLAPWNPAQNLVSHSLYGHVRNPMILGVFCILMGEAVVLGSVALLSWFALFLLANLLYIPLVEEQSLRRRFGEAYTSYRQSVPRWIPRLKPWSPISPHRATGPHMGDP